VMAAGYGLGWLLLRPRADRSRLVFRLGLATTVAFLVVRFINLYGDTRPWSVQSSSTFTALSFLDCTKYPPSLCYVLMTLGPALMLLSALDREMPSWLRPLRVFGRVPMFYYLLHLPLIHGMALAVETLRFGAAPWLLGDPFRARPPAPDGAGFSLVGVFAAWAIALLILYPVCRWFADLKQRRRDVWLSYF
jgi:uncharacterized membrane protein